MQLESGGAELMQVLHDHVSRTFMIDPGLPSDTDLLREGAIDSMGVMELVSFLEDTFGLVVEDEEIVAENFRSLDRIAHYVASKQGIGFASEYVERVRELVAGATPFGAVVLLVTNGDDALLEVPDRVVWHFPRCEDGRYGGGNPVDGEAALASVEVLRDRGATHIVFPEPELWWLDFYGELRAYLESDGGGMTRGGYGVAYSLPVTAR